MVGKTNKVAHLLIKSTGVFSGKPFVDTFFEELECEVKWKNNIAIEGTFIDPSSSGNIILATVEGPASAILRGERTVLNTIAR